MKQKIIGIGIIAIIAVVLVVGVISMYHRAKNKEKWENNANEELTEIKEYHKSKLNSIPRQLTPKEASARGYFVYDGTKDEIYNKERLDRFVKNTEMGATNRIADEIILVIYNINGDPMIYSLGYQAEEKTGYILATDATRVDTSKTELIEIPREYKEVIINTDIPSEHYGITITEDFGISAGIITLTSYFKEAKDIEIARYQLNSKMVSTKINHITLTKKGKTIISEEK